MKSYVSLETSVCAKNASLVPLNFISRSEYCAVLKSNDSSTFLFSYMATSCLFSPPQVSTQVNVLFPNVSSRNVLEFPSNEPISNSRMRSVLSSRARLKISRHLGMEGENQSCDRCSAFTR